MSIDEIIERLREVEQEVIDLQSVNGNLEARIQELEEG